MARGGRSRRDRSKVARRTGREWGVRGSIALVLAALGYLGTTRSLANIVVKVEPASAHALAPGNGVVLANLAEALFVQAPKMDPDYLPAKYARRALQADPTAAEALTVLGIQAQLRGETEQARRIFSYSTAISRRELRPRLWAIEEAASRGDIVGALRNYDIALRTSKEANNLLFPTLAAALKEPRIRAELMPILATRPVWERDFLSYVASSGVEPEGAAALFREGRAAELRDTGEIRANLVNSLVAKGYPDDAWAYYRSFRASARRDRSRDPGFTFRTDARTVFDWQTGEDARLAAVIVQEGVRGWLDFSTPPGIGGEALGQTQALPAGTYVLVGRSHGIEQPEPTRPYWVLTCLGGGELGRVPVSGTGENDAHFSGTFIVPKGCPVQRLSLMIRPSDQISGVSGQIGWAQLVRQR